MARIWANPNEMRQADLLDLLGQAALDPFFPNFFFN